MTTKSPQDECRQDRRGDPGAPAHPGGGHAPDADYTLLVAMPGTSQARPGDPLQWSPARRGGRVLTTLNPAWGDTPVVMIRL